MVTIPGTSPYEDSYVIKFPDGDVSLERNISAISSDHIIHSVLEGRNNPKHRLQILWRFWNVGSNCGCQ